MSSRCEGVRNLLGHANFYRHFVERFAKKFAPLFSLLEKDVPLYFDNHCVEVFDHLKKAFTIVPMIQPPDWESFRNNL
jgi:hypothetical protein